MILRLVTAQHTERASDSRTAATVCAYGLHGDECFRCRHSIFQKIPVGHGSLSYVQYLPDVLGSRVITAIGWEDTL